MATLTLKDLAIASHDFLPAVRERLGDANATIDAWEIPHNNTITIRVESPWRGVGHDETITKVQQEIGGDSLAVIREALGRACDGIERTSRFNTDRPAATWSEIVRNPDGSEDRLTHHPNGMTNVERIRVTRQIPRLVLPPGVNVYETHGRIALHTAEAIRGFSERVAEAVRENIGPDLRQYLDPAWEEIDKPKGSGPRTVEPPPLRGKRLIILEDE